MSSTSPRDDLASEPHPGRPNPEPVPAKQGTIEEHAELANDLRDRDTEDLRSIAKSRNIDGADTMDRGTLLAKLLDEPGTNEI